MLETSSIERASKGIDEFVARRAKETAGRERANELEAELTAKQNRLAEQARHRNRLEWYEYHRNLQEHHARLSEEHCAKADALIPPD